MTKVKPLEKGRKYGRLTVLGEYKSVPVGTKGSHHWIEKCRCDCGKELWVAKNAIVRGHTKSCGCLSVDKTKERTIKHGDWGKRLYRIYYDMKSRCENKNNTYYDYYGGRGIKCEWNNYEEFKNDMSEGYSDDMTIDRINTNGNYCKSNCRRIPYALQQRNTRRNRFFERKGKEMTVPEIYEIEKPNLSYRTFEARLYKYGWSVEKALTPPTHKGRTFN